MLKMKAPAEFGREIRRRRESLGMTLEELAKASGLTPNHIGTLEMGKKDPSLSTIMALAKGFGIPMSEFFGPPDRIAEVLSIFTMISRRPRR